MNTIYDYGVVEIPRSKIDELLRKDRESNLTGWFVLTHPENCNCGYQGKYVTSGNKKYLDHIIVWPTDHDPNLLQLRDDYAEDGFVAHIVEYEQSMGECVSWYQLHAEN
jgi:hypothetical protein